jgi:hypothetical protein
MAQWSSMPYFNSSMEQPGGVGALLWNGAAVSFGRLVVEGYTIPRGALDASLQTRRLHERGGGGSATSTAEHKALGGMCFLRKWTDTRLRISFGGMYTVSLG